MYSSAFMELVLPLSAEEEFNNNLILIHSLPLVRSELVIVLKTDGHPFIKYFNTLNTYIWDLLCNSGHLDLNITILPLESKFKNMESVHSDSSFDAIIMKDADPSTIERFSTLRAQLGLPPVLFHSLTTILEEYALDSNCYLLESEKPVPKLETLILGGTFDTLHLGHKLIISLACYYASKRLIIGVTEESLLMNKMNRNQIRSYQERVHSVKSFIEEISTDMEIEFVPIMSSEGDSVNRTDAQGIIVSSETLSGAKKINAMRARIGNPPLAILIVQRNCTAILSSSYLRELRTRVSELPCHHSHASE